ncbi:hypothetical protein A5481_09940 [Methylobacterium platani]|uniref:Uncharacterized protein n=2 Tax=Methylobacterium platani TaxID=427683 RepID=A0A179SE34_9HYPH|nr:hypothetical protein A5481_09940 [Methylobacterium platani]
MTAEIALLNRSALALAADSAVTLRIGSSQKTYNTAEKIFEFSCNQPIALMIYNNVDYVGVPLDVVVRKHRVDCKQKFSTLKQAADEFVSYLLNFKRTADQEKSYFAAVLIDKYQEIFNKFYDEFAMSSLKMKGKKLSLNSYATLTRLITAALTAAQTTVMDDFLTDITLDQFKEAYGSVCDDAIKIVFRSLDPSSEHRELLYQLAFAVMRSSDGSDFLTGLVFGGFGLDDLFPTLHYFEMDGIYFGQMKIINRSEIDIDRNGHLAQIVSFAQKEMAERFIYGIDASFRDDIADFVSKVIDKIAETKPRSFTASEKRTIRREVLKSFHSTLDQFRGHEHQSILDIVNFMSKKELAEMASALVELTSAKRRFSTAQETVGGPIDVAIVSRSEGFIWIKRKHYFDRESNPGFFNRVYTPQAVGDANGQASESRPAGSTSGS